MKRILAILRSRSVAYALLSLKKLIKRSSGNVISAGNLNIKKEREVKMKPGLWLLIKLVYANLLRPLVYKAINDPNSEWDDFLLERLDALFDYKP